MSPQAIAKLAGIGILIFVVALMAATGTYVVQPGFRGVKVTMGAVEPQFKPEGFGLKAPLISTIIPVSIRQQTAQDRAEAYSSDLQQVVFDMRVLFRIPERSVVRLFQGHLGPVYESLVSPRVLEALKEVVAQQSAEQVVQHREAIKMRALELARQKIGDLLVIEDIVIESITLTPELERAIEAKMVQQQEAEKSRFLQQRAQIEADTVVIRARGEAESIRIRGTALKQNPELIELQVVDKWDGITPLVIGGGDNLVFPLQDLQRLIPSIAHVNPTNQPAR